MEITVAKFGGSSLKDRLCILRVAGIIESLLQNGKPVVAVVSAQGDTTDLLEAKALEINTVPSKREMDALLSAGEVVSSALLAIALETLGISAVSLSAWQVGIMTDSNHSSANIRDVSLERILKELENHSVVVVTGFQGVTANGDITTLGRGGSDTSAVAIAAALKADECRIYTDVDGVYTADPRRISNARLIKTISYRHMILLASNGAQVLHDRCVKAAEKDDVAVRVLSSFRESRGTVVSRAKPPQGPIGIALMRNAGSVSKVSLVGESLNKCKDILSKAYSAAGSFNAALISSTEDMVSFEAEDDEAVRLEEMLHRMFFE